METNYVRVVSEVISACSEKYSNRNKVNGNVNDDFSDSWMCNMYSDWMNNYLTREVFFDSEIGTILPEYADEHFTYAFKVCNSLLDLFLSIGTLQPMLTYEQIGFIAERILKGEV